MQPTSFETFQQLAMHGNVIPVTVSLLADLLTPVSAYMRLYNEGEESFLLESVEGGEKLARYSFLGKNPIERIDDNGRFVEVTTEGGSREIECDIFTYLKTRFEKYKFVRQPDLPRFSGGFVGYFGYDTVRQIEAIPSINAELENTPYAHFGLYDTVLAFDHYRQQIHIITNVILNEGADLKES